MQSLYHGRALSQLIIGGHSQWAAPTNMRHFIYLLLLLGNKHSELHYITSNCWREVTKKRPILVGAIHWLCPLVSVSMTLVVCFRYAPLSWRATTQHGKPLNSKCFCHHDYGLVGTHPLKCSGPLHTRD